MIDTYSIFFVINWLCLQCTRKFLTHFFIKPTWLFGFNKYSNIVRFYFHIPNLKLNLTKCRVAFFKNITFLKKYNCYLRKTLIFILENFSKVDEFLKNLKQIKISRKLIFFLYFMFFFNFSILRNIWSLCLSISVSNDKMRISMSSS